MCRRAGCCRQFLQDLEGCSAEKLGELQVMLPYSEATGTKGRFYFIFFYFYLRQILE